MAIAQPEPVGLGARSGGRENQQRRDAPAGHVTETYHLSD